MINIILAEDHNLVRDGLKSILQDDPEFKIVVEAHNGQEIINALQAGREADIVLTDMNMPVMSGLEATAWIKENRSLLKVIILSALDNEKYVISAFKIGAAGYLLKSISADELRFAIKHVCANNQYICSELTTRFFNRMLTMPDPVTLEIQDGVEFSDREIEILTLLADGFTNQEIADKLFTSKRTVEGNRLSLIEKTGVRNTAALIRFSVASGLIN